MQLLFQIRLQQQYSVNMRQRPGYRSNERSSPRRDSNILNELDDHSNRIKQLLRADLIMLEEENAILKVKCKKIGQYQQKIQMILKQNSQLLSENERLSKLLHQKKQEYEILKDKFEVQSSQKLQYATQFEYQRKKLLNQIDQLQAQLKQIEHIKNSQINELKSQYQLQIQAVKRQTVGSQDIYEQEIRKLREQLDKKDYQLSDTINRLKRFSSEAEYDIIRLKEQKEKLRNELVYVQTDKKKELDSIRAKLQTNYLQQVQSIKKNHLSSLQGFQLQNQKLKDLIDNKTLQNQQLASKFNKQKNSFQDAIMMTKRENEMLRNKIIESERLSDSQKDTLKVKLNKVHQSQIQQMRINHQKYIDCLQNEISKLDVALGKKNNEIQQLIKEKASIRQTYDNEGNRLKEEIQSLQYKIKDIEARNVELIHTYEERIKQKQKHIDYLDKLNQDQAQNFQNQILTLKSIIDHQKAQLQSQRIKAKQKDQIYQQTLDELKHDNNTLRDTLNRERSQKDKQLEDITYQLQGTITTLTTKVDNLTSRNNIVQRQLISLKETITFKEKQIKNLNERVKLSDERQKKLQRQNDELRNKLIKKDQKTNEMLSEQKQRLEETFKFTIDNLKMDHQGALKLQANKQVDLNQRIKRKQSQLDELLRAYKKMRDEMQTLTEQQANKKQMTLKFPGATADLIATKNLFDVFLKTRVLDICGDAKDKQNNKK